jgi:diguanylate cyclase (GGDEF)-like protein
VYVGTEMGLRTVDANGARVALSGPLDDGEALRVTSLAEAAADDVWLGSERDGVWRYRFKADGGVAGRGRIEPAQGLRYGRIAEAWVERLQDGALVVSTREGWFRRQGDRFTEDTFGDLGTQRRAGELLRIVQAPGGELWAYGVNRVFRHEGKGAWREMDIGGFRRGGLVAHAFEADGRALFVGGMGLLMQEPHASSRAVGVPEVQLRNVLLIEPDGKRVPQSLARTGSVTLPPGDYSVRFEFALPDLASPGAQRYRGRLVGYEKEFSEWAPSHGYTYSRLRAGDYRFELQARDSRGRVTSIVPLKVSVEPRWHATRTARLLAALVLLLLLWAVVVAIIRLRTQRLTVQKRALEETVAKRTSELADANRRLEVMAHIDGLTGIPNRRRLDEYLAVVWTQCGERKRPLSLLAIDVDRFKDYNDQRGHLAGDELLRQLADRLAFCLRRAEDLLARYGGEEFLVVMPGADLTIAATLAEKMRREIETSGLGATISIGVSSRVPDENASLTDLVARADAALYLAKKAGRNRVEMARAHAETPT